ncbi:phosphotransferase enzyme family-domain-containing protein [Mycena filopes]|nr:phosphotransferase enzyme family-domain-containing protein [Mycena filopes]
MSVPCVFDSKDEAIPLDLEPLVYDEWTPSAPGIAGLTPIIERASSLLDGRTQHAHTRKPFSATDAVMDIELDDGRSAFVRTLVFEDEDPARARWKRTRLLSEHSILLWFAANAPDVPVPRVLAFNEASGTLVTTLLPGLNALHAYPHLEPAVKERSIISWARISVGLFRLSAPQRPFSAIEDSTLPTSYHSVSPEHTFTINDDATLLTFFTNAIAARRARSASINNADAQEALSRRLDRLLTRLKPLLALAEETPFLSTRFVLTHRDPRASNVLLHETSGEVIGIVDWEYNAAMPACMAAAYPDWIRYSIIESPLYRNPALASQFETVYVESRERRNLLCDLYERAVKELDEEYYRCLIFGIRLRDALAWIENSYSDHDGFAMDRWVEDHLSVQTEADHRSA